MGELSPRRARQKGRALIQARPVAVLCYPSPKRRPLRQSAPPAQIRSRRTETIPARAHDSAVGVGLTRAEPIDANATLRAVRVRLARVDEDARDFRRAGTRPRPRIPEEFHGVDDVLQGDYVHVLGRVGPVGGKGEKDYEFYTV